MSSRPPVSRGGDRSNSSDISAWPDDTDEFVVPPSSGPRAARSLPPWIDSYEGGHGPPATEQLRLLQPPGTARPAQHNAQPSETQRRVSKDGFVDYEDAQLGPARGSRARIPHFLRYGRASQRGRKWDHLRTAEPVIVASYHPTVAGLATGSEWHDFIHSSAWGRARGEESELVDAATLEALQPNFAEKPSEGEYYSYGAIVGKGPRGAASRRRRAIAPTKRVWNIVMRHSLSPLVFRLIVMVTSILALGVAGRIFHLESADDNDSAERTQSVVAIVVDCVAIPYIAYMIWDEYTGKPLGLRSAVSKMSLILLDLFFIIFKSASTALAFESLIYHNVTESMVRTLAKPLAAFMLVGLIAWTMTFSVNIFRTVERLGGGEEER